MAEGTRMKQRRDTAANWDTSDYVLAEGEIGFATDANVIKMGDGVNGWTNLEVLFTGLYLPVEGIAANSELLEGISSDGFVKVLDTDTSALPNTYVKRTSDGRVRGANAVSGTDLVNYDSMATYTTDVTVPAARLMTSSRLVTADFAIQATDVGKRILINHASSTAFVTATLPANSTLTLPIGSYIDFVTQGNGAVKLVPSGAEVIRGTNVVFPNYDVVRLIRTSTLEWLAYSLGKSNTKFFPRMRVFQNATVNYVSGTYHGIAYQAIDNSTLETWNPANEWFEIPVSGIATARRIVVKQDGEYEIDLNFAGSLTTATTTRIVKMTADNTPGNTLKHLVAAGTAPSLHWRGRLSAGESVGGVHQNPSATDVGAVDDPNGARNDFRIVRVGN